LLYKEGEKDPLWLHVIISTRESDLEQLNRFITLKQYQKLLHVALMLSLELHSLNTRLERTSLWFISFKEGMLSPLQVSVKVHWKSSKFLVSSQT